MNNYIDEQEYLEQIDDTEYYEKQIEELQQIIDKAIEYINKNGILDLNGYDLLNILKGEDDE